MAVIGLYSIRQIILFRQVITRVEKDSTNLVNEIKRDFSSIELIGKIDSSIKTYLLSPSKELLKEINDLIFSLKKNIPSNFHGDINRLEKSLKTLAIRMESLRANQKAIVKAENNLIKLLFRAHMQCVTEKVCLGVLEQVDDLFLKFRTESSLAITGDDDRLLFQKKAQYTIEKLLKL